MATQVPVSMNLSGTIRLEQTITNIAIKAEETEPNKNTYEEKGKR